MLAVVPLTLAEANAFVARFHRHHRPTLGHRFSLGAVTPDGDLVGVSIVGRPVARGVDWRRVCEVTRLCTDGTRNACSLLYAASARTAAAMGYERIITYTLASEPGTSLRASGWSRDGEVYGRAWDCPSRPRTAKAPTTAKVRWARELNPARPDVRNPEPDREGQETLDL